MLRVRRRADGGQEGWWSGGGDDMVAVAHKGEDGVVIKQVGAHADQ